MQEKAPPELREYLMAKKKPKRRPGFEAALLKEEGRQRILYSQEPVGRESHYGSGLTRDEVLKYERKRKLRQAKMGASALIKGTIMQNRVRQAEKLLYEQKLKKPAYRR